MDLDVMVIRSFDELRKQRCTLGMEHDDRINGGVIVCAKDEPFLYLWLDSFYEDFRNEWAYNSGQVPTKLAKKYPHLIHIEQKRFHYPNWAMLNQIWGNKTYPWKDNYTIHMWIRLTNEKDGNPDENPILEFNSTFNQIARLVYYGK